MTVLVIVLSLIGIYFTVGMVVIGAWEIVSDIKGSCCVPTWLDDAYYFVVEKWFFFN